VISKLVERWDLSEMTRNFLFLLLDNDRVPFGPVDRTEVATYTSFFEHDGRAYFWYPDRKHFLLGKDLTARLSE